MNRPTAFTTPIFALAFCSLLWLSSLAPALAAMVTDTFPLTVTGKEWCRDDSKFFDTINVKTKDGATITLKHDGTDIQATINTNGGNTTIDAMTLTGRALPANKVGSIAQLVLSGRDLGNPDHFITLRGTATFDKAGNLTKVTGTLVYQVLSDSGGIPNIDCFGSGTFATSKKPSPGGTLTVTNAPASVGGKLVATFVTASKQDVGGTWFMGVVSAAEIHPTRTEALTLGFEYESGVLTVIPGVLFLTQESPTLGDGNGWGCTGSFPGPGLPLETPTCTGVTVNRVSGTITFSNTVLTDPDGSLPPITLNGTLNFKPF